MFHIILTIIDKLLTTVLIPELKDEAVGDLWECHSHMLQEEQNEFIATLITIWRGFLLIQASVQIYWNKLLVNDDAKNIPSTGGGAGSAAPKNSIPEIEREKRMRLPTIEVTGAPVTALPLKYQVKIILDWAKHSLSRIVCVANVHMMMESHWHSDLRSVLEHADLVTPDGMPLVWMMRLQGATHQDRVSGMDIFMSLCHQATDAGISIYLLGSTQDVLSKMQARLKTDFPQLKVAGVESLPFRPLTKTEDEALIERVNHSGAGLTFVSLGCPKQERWMADHHGKIQSVMLGVGGVFPVYAGITKHAPKLMRETGLEWLYQLIQEPKRLWKRYQTTIPIVIWLVLGQLLSSRLSENREQILQTLREDEDKSVYGPSYSSAR